MRSVSERFAEQIFRPHRLAVKVIPTSVGAESLPVVDGSVTLDLTASVRGRCDLTFNDPALIPTSTSSTLAPYGQELQVFRGISYGTDDEELTSLGIFRIEETSVSDSDALQIQVSGLDRAQIVADAVYEAEDTIAGGTNFATVIEDIIVDGYGAAEVSIDANDFTLPTLDVEEGADRWEFCREIAEAVGYDLYFDNDGVVRGRSIGSVDATPVAYLVEGDGGLEVSDPALLDLSSRWSRTESHNKWIVIGDNPESEGSAPPRGEATDDDPSSPSYYGGTYGRKPEIFHSSFIESDAQAEDAAEGKKAKESGTTQNVDFGALVNPALEPGDTVQITRTRKNQQTGETVTVADENHLIDSLTIPLSAEGTMTGQTRARQVTG